MFNTKRFIKSTKQRINRKGRETKNLIQQCNKNQ